MGRTERSLFAQLETSFRLLTTGPQPLSVDGGLIGHGMPDRLVPMDECRRLLLDKTTSYATRDAAMRVLLAQARAEGGAATIGLVGVVLPGVRADARPIIRACPAYAPDLEAEILTGLVEAIGDLDLTHDRLATRLIRRAVTAGRVALYEFLTHEHAEQLMPQVAPAPPATHPDLLLAEVVADGVLSPQEADLISEHRVAGTSLEELAARAGVDVQAIRKRRQRAERALLAWLEVRKTRNADDA